MIKKPLSVLSVLILLLSGCTHNQKLAQQYTQRSDEKVSISNREFPVSVSRFLDEIREYDFYDQLDIRQIEWQQVSELKKNDYTLYVLTDPKPSVQLLLNESDVEEAAAKKRSLSDAEYEALPIYQYDQISIIYTGQNKEIVKVLSQYPQQ